MELTVQIVCFGSAWWVRPGEDRLDSQRYGRHAAYFNSTGIQSGSKIHTAGPVRGMIRFNATSGLNPHRTRDNIGAIFCFTEIEEYRETNRLLALRRLPSDATATHFLVSMRSFLHGTVSLNTKWHSQDAEVIAMSRYRGQQELLLLLTRESVLHTSLGDWKLVCSTDKLPRLMLFDPTEPCTGENE
jgi:hypothetical protein